MLNYYSSRFIYPFSRLGPEHLDNGPVVVSHRQFGPVSLTSNRSWTREITEQVTFLSGSCSVGLLFPRKLSQEENRMPGSNKRQRIRNVFQVIDHRDITKLFVFRIIRQDGTRRHLKLCDRPIVSVSERAGWLMIETKHYQGSVMSKARAPTSLSVRNGVLV